MQMQMVIFLIFVSVTLFANALIIWFTYKAFANMTLKVTEAALQFRASSSTHSFLETLKTASAQSVVLTASAKERLAQCEPGLTRAESRLGYGLAKVDVRVERTLNKICKETANAQAAILRPTRRFGAAAAGVREVMVLISQSENGGDANSRRNQ